MIRPLRVYIGGKYGAHENDVRRLAAALNADEQYVVAFDWTALHVVRPLRSPFNIEHAQAMRSAVQVAEIVIIFDHADLRGGLVELGLALAHKPCAARVFIVGDERETVFESLPEVLRVPTVRHVLDLLLPEES